MKMVKSQFLCTFTIILISFADLSEEKPMNGGREVKSLSSFGSIIQTEESTEQRRYNREFLIPISNFVLNGLLRAVRENSSILLKYATFEGCFLFFHVQTI